LVAGLNAARAAQDKDPVIFERSSSYIGVMVDDLVTRGVTEPYRMFTSRAEFRLSLRADNADQRLTPLGITLGCVGEERKRAFGKKMARLDAARSQLERKAYTAQELAQFGLKVKQDGSRRTAFQLLSFPEVDFETVLRLDPMLAEIDEESRCQLEKDALYANYLARQQRDVEMLRRDEAQTIPPDFDFASVRGLSHELRDKLMAVRPANLSQAGRIDGMTPAALTLLLVQLRQVQRQKSA